HATSFSSGVLTFTNSFGQTVHLHFSGSHTLASFHLSDDGNFNGTANGTKITVRLDPWKRPLNGDFAVASNWNPASVPTASHNAAIDAIGTYTVSSAADETVNTLSTIANAALSIVGDVIFDIANGTGLGAGRSRGESGTVLEHERRRVEAPWWAL